MTTWTMNDWSAGVAKITNSEPAPLQAVSFSNLPVNAPSLVAPRSVGKFAFTPRAHTAAAGPPAMPSASGGWLTRLSISASRFAGSATPFAVKTSTCVPGAVNVPSRNASTLGATRRRGSPLSSCTGTTSAQSSGTNMSTVPTSNAWLTVTKPGGAKSVDESVSVPVSVPVSVSVLLDDDFLVELDELAATSFLSSPPRVNKKKATSATTTATPMPMNNGARDLPPAGAAPGGGPPGGGPT